MDMNLTFDDRDEFNRKQVANKVSSLLNSNIELSPMVIDGGWGKGKTEFCIKLINLMSEEDSHQLIYIDAFKADHANEPLLTILAEVAKQFPDEDSQSSFVEKIIPALRFSLKTTGKAAIGHILKQDADDVANEFDQVIQEVSDKAIDYSVEALLKDHVKADKNLAALQSTLKELAAEKPIIIFIDELDRCRPDFAVDLLEVIKHTLDVEGVKFVLITNIHQLKASINHCYGHSVDSQKYLDKFLKFTIQLPDTHTQNGHDFHAVSVTHYENLIANSELLKEHKLDEGAVLAIVERLIHVNDVSLREVETFIRNLEIYQILSDSRGFRDNLVFGYKLLRVFGVLLYSLKPKIAKSITSDTADASEISRLIGEEQIQSFDGDHPYPEHPQVLATMIGQECDINSDRFTPTAQDDGNKWEELIQSYFRSGGFPPTRGQRIKIIKHTIETMNLNSIARH